MPTSLAIHHLGLRGPGDSTLIVVRDGAANAIVWSLLCDGGLEREGLAVANAVAGILQGASLTAVVCTHYDADHTGGLNRVLQAAGLVSATTLIIDRGVPTPVLWMQQFPGNAQVPPNLLFGYRALGTLVRRNYLGLVPHLVNATPSYLPNLVTRPTAAVINEPAVGLNPPTNWAFLAPTFWLQNAFSAPGWLVGNALVDAHLNAALVNTSPRVQVRVISANRTMMGPRGPEEVPFTPDPSEDDLEGSAENQGCVALLLTFGNFTYYCPGDLETPQENQLVLPNHVLYQRRVDAMKLSHHGAATASSELFLSAIQPRVAIASNGLSNIYGHPRLGALANGVGRLDQAAWTNGQGAQVPNSLVNYFMTGWFYTAQLRGHVPIGQLYNGVPGSPLAVPTTRAVVAGVASAAPQLAAAGAIDLTVSDVQAQQAPANFTMHWHDAYSAAFAQWTY